MVSGGEGGDSFFEAGFVFDVEGDWLGFDVAGRCRFQDLAGEAGEDFAGAEFDEVGDALGDEELDALDPADGTGDLADEAIADIGAAGEEAGVDVACDGEAGVAEVDPFEGGGELVFGRLHEVAMEGRGDFEQDGFFLRRRLWQARWRD